MTLNLFLRFCIALEKNIDDLFDGINILQTKD